MKILFDLFPLLLFFGAFKFYDIYIATAVAIAATFVQVTVFWARHRRFEAMHLMTLGIISVFGGLTIYLQDDAFIKWKPTVVNWLFGFVILAMLFTRKSALEYVMGRQISLPTPVWRKLNWAWAAFFLVLGLLNLYVAFYYNPGADEAVRTQTWVHFKVFGILGLTLVFAIAQMLFISRHILPDSVTKEE
ncbi:MAG: septation protein A [Gammaproteobacteria bacterium]|nr:septation protein A [Gammaproteobacteria bacterium]